MVHDGNASHMHEEPQPDVELFEESREKSRCIGSNEPISYVWIREATTFALWHSQCKVRVGSGWIHRKGRNFCDQAGNSAPLRWCGASDMAYLQRATVGTQPQKIAMQWQQSPPNRAGFISRIFLQSCTCGVVHSMHMRGWQLSAPRQKADQRALARQCHTGSKLVAGW
jgi:hypothetical protein